MTIDARELNQLTRKATELMLETADVPILLRNRLGEQHQLAQAAKGMLESIETLVRELRSFEAGPEPSGSDTSANV